MSDTLPVGADNATVSTDLLQVRHTTRYRYARPVTFNEHRAMFRPHESADLRLTSFEITTTPECVHHWMHDVFSNSKAVLDFNGSPPSDTLQIDCVFAIVRSALSEPDFPIAAFARRFPFLYDNDQHIDLAPLIHPEYMHADMSVRFWAQGIADAANGDTWAILENINSVIHKTLAYNRREEPGVQPPRETLALGAGSCRDFAVLMLEAVRQLGFAARFVTGYLYDPLTDKDGAIQGATLSGSGATHAWVQVFLPGAGWIEFDPTNGLIASGHLIRTGVARTPSQAVPLEGSFQGDAQDFLGMDVEVEVTALAPTLYG